MSSIFDLGKKSLKLRFDEAIMDSSMLGVAGDNNSRVLIVELFGEDGQILENPQINLKLLMAAEADPSNIIYANGYRIDNSKYQVIIPGEIFSKKQYVECQFKVELSGSTIFTPIFKKYVDRSLIGTEREGRSIYLNLDKMANFVTNYEDKKNELSTLATNEKRGISSLANTEKGNITQHAATKIREVNSEVSSKISSAKDEINTYVESEKSEINSHTLTKINEFNENSTSVLDGYFRENLLIGSIPDWTEKVYSTDSYTERTAIYTRVSIPAEAVQESQKYTLSYILEVKDLVYEQHANFQIMAPAKNSTGTTFWSRYAKSNLVYFDSANKTIKVTSPILFDGSESTVTNGVSYYGSIAFFTNKVRSGTIKIKELKLEKGENATPWCYSNKDYAEMSNELKTLKSTVADLVKRVR